LQKSRDGCLHVGTFSTPGNPFSELETLVFVFCGERVQDNQRESGAEQRALQDVVEFFDFQVPDNHENVGLLQALERTDGEPESSAPLSSIGARHSPEEAGVPSPRQTVGDALDLTHQSNEVPGGVVRGVLNRLNWEVRSGEFFLVDDCDSFHYFSAVAVLMSRKAFLYNTTYFSISQYLLWPRQP
jgi:hypothetical protein